MRALRAALPERPAAHARVRMRVEEMEPRILHSADLVPGAFSDALSATVEVRLLEAVPAFQHAFQHEVIWPVIHQWLENDFDAATAWVAALPPGQERDNVIGALPQRNAGPSDWGGFWRDARLAPQLERALGEGRFGGDAIEQVGYGRRDEHRARQQPQAHVRRVARLERAPTELQPRRHVVRIGCTGEPLRRIGQALRIKVHNGKSGKVERHSELALRNEAVREALVTAQSLRTDIRDQAQRERQQRRSGQRRQPVGQVVAQLFRQGRAVDGTHLLQPLLLLLAQRGAQESFIALPAEQREPPRRRVERLLLEECFSVAQYAFDAPGKVVGSGCGQHCSPAAHEQGITEDVAEPRKGPAHCRLGDRKPFRRPGDASLLVKCVQRQKQVKVERAQIGHADTLHRQIPLDQ